jgi:hypothetical protein
MTLRNRGEPEGFRRVAAPAMARAMRRANNKDPRAQADPRTALAFVSRSG